MFLNIPSLKLNNEVIEQLRNFVSPPTPLGKKRIWENLRGIWFSSTCENRDMRSEFVLLILTGSVTFLLDKKAYKTDLMDRIGSNALLIGEK